MRKPIKRMVKKVKKYWRRQSTKQTIIFVVAFALIGVGALAISKAAGPSANLEAEDGSIAGCAKVISEANASNSQAAQFGCSGDPSANAGAHLPINYNLASLTGTIRYVATNGSDATSNTGTSVSSPLATLSRAISLSGANNTIVVRGGTYRNQSNMLISGSGKNGLKIIAYPGETPEFNGAQTVSSGWTTEGSLRYIAYVPRPVKNGGGVTTFEDPNNLQNFTGDGIGRYPDQAWVGNTALRQVSSKAQVQDGRFWVDAANNRLYMTSSDVAQGNIETSQPGSAPNATNNRALRTSGATNLTIEGLRFTRYSPNAGDYGVLLADGGSHDIVFRNVEVSHSPYDGIVFGTELNNPKVENSTFNDIGWKGLSANQSDNLILDGLKISNIDPFDEFTSSPTSGAMKSSRTRGTIVKNSQIFNNNSHGLWFDQSHIDVTVANNTIEGNRGAGVFFEISDGLWLVNNYIKAPNGFQAVKMAGSSGLKLANNTLVGGIDPVGVYTDPRSLPGCALDANNCGGIESWPGERGGRFNNPPAATMDWMPRLDYMINNIIAYPTGNGLCAATAMCLLTHHTSGASAPIDTIIHQAEPARGIPKTFIDGNVYANGSGSIIRVSSPAANYTTVAAFTTAMASSPVSIAGIDANGRQGNSWVNADGSPTTALANVHAQAIAIPTNTAINPYISAGTKHYGVTYK